MGESFVLPEKALFKLGRNLDSQIRFTDACVSGGHCVIERTGNVDMLTDNRSRNGTFVNGSRVTHRPLSDGDVIVIGETALQYHRLPDTPPSGKPDTEVVRVRDAWKKSEASVCDKFQLRGRGLGAMFQTQDESPQIGKLRGALDAFYRLVTVTHQESDLRVVMEQALDIAVKAMEADRGAIVLCGAPGEIGQLEVMRRSEGRPQEKMVISQTIVDTCFNEGVSILTSFGTPTQTAHATRSVLMQGIQSVMCVPIEAEKTILGVVYLDSISVVDRFLKPDLEILAAMASILGTLVEKRVLVVKAQAATHQLDYVLSHVPVGIFVTTLDGRFTLWGDHCERLFGYPSQAVVGRDGIPLLLAHPDLAPSLLEAAKTSGFEADMELKRRDGTNFLGNVSCKKFFDPQGNLVGFAGMILDITERRNLQDQLVQQEKMASLGLLAAGISHDFRNLIAPMYGFAQLASLNPAATPKLVNAVLIHAKHAVEITNSLLTYARRRDDASEVVDVTKILDNVLDLVSSELAMCNIRVTKLYTAGPSVRVNPGLVQNVFLNLLLNAREAMPRGGMLTLAVEASPEDLSLRFTDTGIGIKKEHVRNLFQPFFTTKEGTGGSKKGTGLGLYNSFNIIRAQGGMLSCESEEGKGTSFTIRFPLHQPEDLTATVTTTTSRPTPIPVRHAPRHKVLVIEDNEGMNNLWRSLLEPFEQVYTTTVEDALSRCREENYDLILVDVVQTGLSDRFRMVASVRDAKPGAYLVLVISNPLEETEAAKVMECTDEILQKPFEVSQVQEILSAAAKRMGIELSRTPTPPAVAAGAAGAGAAHTPPSAGAAGAAGAAGPTGGSPAAPR